MTASTETERATFEAVASDDGKWPQAIERDAKGNYLLMQTAQGWRWWQEAWQAARRAPAVPVPQGLREAAQRAHDWMDSQADSQSKGNYHSFDLLCLRQERDALAEALAAAPHPPEADHIADAGKMVAAPVQLPENIREGEPYDNPAFEALARALGVWGTAQSAVCAQFWIAAKEQST